MTRSLRYIKIYMVASIALFFSIVAIDNVIDFNSNRPFVEHVLSMDTTFHDTAIMWRSITNPLIQMSVYFFIIGWETATAILCWIGCFTLLQKVNGADMQFKEAKNMAFIGLFFGFLLYMVGFIVIGGEWFSMWQSPNWNGQKTAGLFLSMIMFVMIFLNTND